MPVISVTGNPPVLADSPGTAIVICYSERGVHLGRIHETVHLPSAIDILCLLYKQLAAGFSGR
jgi:hypothetical protein